LAVAVIHTVSGVDERGMSLDVEQIVPTRA
jgi:hypothetical protein